MGKKEFDTRCRINHVSFYIRKAINNINQTNDTHTKVDIIDTSIRSISTQGLFVVLSQVILTT